MNEIQVKGFEIIETIFEDTISTYYKAKHLKLNNFVLLRVLPKKRESYAKEFQKQAESQSKINHPLVFQALDLWEKDGNHFQSYQYFEGETIYHRFKRTKKVIKEKVALKIILQLAELFEYTEKKELCHRGLSPKNIFLGEDNEIRVHEFGFFEDPTVNFYQTKKVTSPFYISPEQASGVDPSELTIQSDIYSAGMILFHMVVGRPAFEGSKLEIMSAHLKKEIPWPKDINEDLSTALCNLLQQMTEKTPETRFPNAKSFRKAVQQAIDGRYDYNPNPSPIKKIEGRKRKSPTAKVPIIQERVVVLKEEKEVPPNPQRFRELREKRKKQELIATVIVSILVIGLGYAFYLNFSAEIQEENNYGQNPQEEIKEETESNQEAKRFLDYVSQFLKTHPLPADHKESLEKLDQLLQKYPKTVEAEIAKTLKESKEKDFEEMAQRRFLKAKSASKTSFEEGAFFEAEQSYTRYPEVFAKTKWYKQAQLNAQIVRELGLAQVKKMMYKAQDLAEEGEFKKAILVYKKIVQAGYHEYESEARIEIKKTKLILKKLSDD